MVAAGCIYIQAGVLRIRRCVVPQCNGDSYESADSNSDRSENNPLADETEDRRQAGI